MSWGQAEVHSNEWMDVPAAGLWRQNSLLSYPPLTRAHHALPWAAQPCNSPRESERERERERENKSVCVVCVCVLAREAGKTEDRDRKWEVVIKIVFDNIEFLNKGLNKEERVARFLLSLSYIKDSLTSNWGEGWKSIGSYIKREPAGTWP